MLVYAQPRCRFRRELALEQLQEPEPSGLAGRVYILAHNAPRRTPHEDDPLDWPHVEASIGSRTDKSRLGDFAHVGIRRGVGEAVLLGTA